MSQQFPHFRLTVADTHNYQDRQTTLFGISDTGTVINLGNLDYHISIAKIHSYLVFQRAILSDLPYTKRFNTSWIGDNLEGGSLAEGVDVAVVITYKKPYVVNGQQVVVSFALSEGLSCNNIFYWWLLQ